jgi:hypothetical protein
MTTSSDIKVLDEEQHHGLLVGFFTGTMFLKEKLVLSVKSLLKIHTCSLLRSVSTTRKLSENNI